MSLHKLSLITGGLAVVLAACATATPEPSPDATSAPAPTQEEAMEEVTPSVTVGDQDAILGVDTRPQTARLDLVRRRFGLVEGNAQLSGGDHRGSAA